MAWPKELVGQEEVKVAEMLQQKVQLICLLLLINGCSQSRGRLGAVPQPVQAEQQATMSVNKEAAEVREAVKAFLTTWLVERNIVKAIRFFTSASFSNEAMFHESCAGYIKTVDQKSTTAVKKGVEKFLSDFIVGSKPRNLNEVLNSESIALMAEQFDKKTLNDVRDDRFLVVHSRPSDLESFSQDARAVGFLRQHLPAEGFYVSFIPAGQGVCYLFWIRDGTAWRIYHAALICI